MLFTWALSDAVCANNVTTLNCNSLFQCVHQSTEYLKDLANSNTTFVVPIGVSLHAGHTKHSLKDRLAGHEYAIRTPKPQLSPVTALQRCKPQGPLTH